MAKTSLPKGDMSAEWIEAKIAKLLKVVGSGIYFFYFQYDNFITYCLWKGNKWEIKQYVKFYKMKVEV